MEEGFGDEKVDFEKYANIISLFNFDKKKYWVIKHFDSEVASHLQDRFGTNPEEGVRIFEEYKRLTDEIVLSIEDGLEANSDKAVEIAKQYWKMVMDFTGGDMSLIPKLMEFNKSKGDWENSEMKEKQQKADEFIGKALEEYFRRESIAIAEMEG